MIKEHKDYYENGKLWMHCFLKDDKRHGEYKDYYKNGQMWEHCFYKDDKRHGENKYWDEDGQLQKHRFYKDDNDITKDIVSIVSDINNITEEEKLMIKLTHGIDCLC